MRKNRTQDELIGLYRYKVEQLGKLIYGQTIYDAIELAGILRDLLLSDKNGLYGQLKTEFPQLKKRRKELYFETLFLGSTLHDRVSKK